MSTDRDISGSSDAVLELEPCGGGFTELWKVAYPLIITNATHTVMQFVDRKFLAMDLTRDVAAAWHSRQKSLPPKGLGRRHGIRHGEMAGTGS